MTTPRTILVAVPYYRPAFRAGGPIRSTENLIAALGDEFRFKVVTADRDLGDEAPFDSVAIDRWQSVGKASVLYSDFRTGALSRWRRILRTEPFDVLYLNGLFSPRSTFPILVLRRLGQVPRTPVIVAPRGELSSAAMRVRGLKKRAFIAGARELGLVSDVTWHATTTFESGEITAAFTRGGRAPNVVIAPNIASSPADPPRARPPKRPGSLRVLFMSRLVPKKNLEGVLRVLSAMQGAVTMDIFGAIEDSDYWSACQRRIAELPRGVEVSYRGTVPASDVPAVMEAYDVFFLPTWNENYGHVVIEALAAGLPVLISDQTAFRELEPHGCGWDLPVDAEDRFRAALESLRAMGPESHDRMVSAAREYARNHSARTGGPEAHRSMLRQVLSELAR